MYDKLAITTDSGHMGLQRSPVKWSQITEGSIYLLAGLPLSTDPSPSQSFTIYKLPVDTAGPLSEVSKTPYGRKQACGIKVRCCPVAPE